MQIEMHSSRLLYLFCKFIARLYMKKPDNWDAIVEFIWGYNLQLFPEDLVADLQPLADTESSPLDRYDNAVYSHADIEDLLDECLRAPIDLYFGFEFSEEEYFLLETLEKIRDDAEEGYHLSVGLVRKFEELKNKHG